MLFILIQSYFYLFILGVMIMMNHDSMKVEADKFLLYSSMDDNFRTVLQNYTDLKIIYANRFNYEYIYSLNDLNIDWLNNRPHSLRIYGALNLLTGNYSAKVKHPVDWIVYLDGDAIVSERGLPMELLVDRAKEWAMNVAGGRDKTPCQFIAQDGSTLLNSGFWMLRNSSWSVELLKRWKTEVESASDHDYYIWVYDQGALMNTIIHYAANITNDTYSDHCWRGAEMLARNFCYSKTLKQLGFPQNKRKFGPICLLPIDQGLPLRHHSHANEMRYSGEMIFHKKHRNRDTLEAMSKNLSYDPQHKKIIFPDGLIVKGNTKSLYLIMNGTKRQFTGWDSFVKRGYDLDMVIPLDFRTFNDIPLGEDLSNIITSKS